MNDASPATVFDGKAFVRDLTTAPGVYRMYSSDDSVLYVGKALSLKKRVTSYFLSTVSSPRIAVMIKQIARMEITVTRTESEALILENQLIKSLRPRYNVLLRDDKSYPYILITDETWPRLAFHRGPRAVPGRYFGPYPSASAVTSTLDLMQKIFKLRNCEDSVFRNRSRPCLQHQIGRCTAPCVGLIAPRDYDADTKRAMLFLDGRSGEVVDDLTRSMEAASASLQFELAAYLRDQVTGIRRIQAKQYIEGEQAEMDVLACAMEQGTACVLLLAFRNGMNLGTRSFFPKTNGVDNASEVLDAFVSQYYFEQRPPREIVLSHAIEDAELLEKVLSAQAGRKVEIKTSVRGDRARYLDMAVSNAVLALSTEITSNVAQRKRLEALQEMLGMDHMPQRMECFDISHTQGEATVASCVVFNQEGALRNQYRRFNIDGITPGDDYAAMHQALTRRFKRAVEEGVVPDVLFIDGGEGQLTQARDVLKELGVTQVMLVGVAKGVERRAGDEQILLPDGRILRPGAHSPALQWIQQIRDEAHRFAITGHRGRRQKKRDVSRLEDIPGIGPKRRSALLKHFGGLAALKEAGTEEIARVAGVNAELAARIYASLHGLESKANLPEPPLEP
ncbi:MAG TPA: excinuclease ABC subunit UvrC [Arenimonas sp.]|nr:excinuclease ABC subunit UvrC [Arenimonas sp.]HOZ04475.1 excinuclease ABC subunit UvrC [Arenimonas sp.]HPW31278.1 excinuclease ABC subunit UvrC [Arenimonas sp.]